MAAWRRPSWRSLEHRDFAPLLPHLYVVADEKPSDIGCRGVIAIATQIDRSDEMAIRSDEVRTVMGHTILAELGGSAKNSLSPPVAAPEAVICNATSGD